MKKRRIALTVAAVILVAGVVAGREKPSTEIIQPSAPAAVDDGIDLERLHRGEASLPRTDPFARKDFASVEVRKPPESRPVAPPLPFQYFGRLTENGKTEVFVMRGDDLLSIAAGQKLGDYRVDDVADSSISFTYLPLKTKQTLNVPAVNQ